jgi:predicted nucleic-acid-binding protein
MLKNSEINLRRNMKGAKRTKKIYFIDTNIFVRTVVEDEDAKQLQESKAFLEMVRSGRIKAATSSLILAEMSWVLGSAYKLTKKEILPYSAGIVNL